MHASSAPSSCLRAGMLLCQLRCWVFPHLEHPAVYAGVRGCRMSPGWSSMWSRCLVGKGSLSSQPQGFVPNQHSAWFMLRVLHGTKRTLCGWNNPGSTCALTAMLCCWQSRCWPTCVAGGRLSSMVTMCLLLAPAQQPPGTHSAPPTEASSALS